MKKTIKLLTVVGMTVAIATSCSKMCDEQPLQEKSSNISESNTADETNNTQTNFNKNAVTANGVVESLFPPTSNGTVKGVGMIEGSDGKKYIFHTPNDNNNEPLSVGGNVKYSIDNHNHITNVTLSREN